MSYTLNKTGAQIDAILDRAEAGGAIDGAIALKAPLASPALTGTPTAPTASPGTDTTQIATTEFVTDAVQTEAEADALRYAPAIVVPTSSAPVASFSDGADGVPIKSGTFQVEPKQDLHGQAYPWPAGGSRNMIPDGTDGSNGYVADSYLTNANGVGSSSTGNYVSEYFKVQANTVYTWGFGTTTPPSISSGPAVCFYDSDKNFIPGSGVNLGGVASHIITTPANAVYARSSQRVDYLLQFELGSTATPAVPYSNICPITGYTGATVVASSKNILSDATAMNQLTQYGNVITGTYKLIKGFKYALSFDTVNSGITIYRQSKSISGLDFSPYSVTCNGQRQTLIGTADATGTYTGVTLMARLTATSATGTGLCSNIQLERIEESSSTSTDYTDYTGYAETTVDWTDEAGTVYGGTLEYKGGGAWKLTKTKASVDLGTLTWTYDSQYSRFQSSAVPSMKSAGTGRSMSLLCSTYQTIDDQRALADVPDYSVYNATGAWIYVHDSRYTDAAVFTTAVTGVQLVYELATPTTYDLTGADVLTLLGANNIWSDTGDAAVEYRADTKLYIDGQIASLQALVLENNG